MCLQILLTDFAADTVGRIYPIILLSMENPAAQDSSLNPMDISCNGVIIRIDDLSCNYIDVSNNISVVCNKYYIQYGEPSNNTIPAIFTHKKKTFISVFSTQEQQVTTGSPILFHMTESKHGYCCHLENTGDVWICAPGYYQVYMNFYHLEPCQFSLVKNGTDIVASSTIGSLSGLSQNSTSFIMKVRRSDMSLPCQMSSTGYACLLQILNHSSITPYVTLLGSSSSGNTIQQVTAVLSIVSM